MAFANTWAKALLALAPFALGGALMAQDPATPTPIPKNPIPTKPEGTGQTCSYSASRSDGKTTGSSTCPPGSAAQRFPFPGEDPNSAEQGAAKADAPQAVDGTQTRQPGSTAQKFPYPGEAAGGDKGSAAGAPNTPSPLQDAGSSGAASHPDEGSSSSSSSSSGAPGENPFADDPADKDKADNLPAPKRGRKKLPPVARQSPDEREEEDVKVAAFYQDTGNYRAAYSRAKDAIAITDTDAEAHFILAESARKLGKLDEAVQQYKRCLELDPLPKQKRESQKALKEMTGS